MRRTIFLCALTLGGCGLENFFGNAGHDQIDRPASKVMGTAFTGTSLEQITVIDGDGNEVEPFLESMDGPTYELRLPSSKYGMLRVRTVTGNIELRSLVPGVGEESEISGVDVDVRNAVETIIAEARLSADGDNLKKVTPEAYKGTRVLIRAAFDQPGSNAAQLLAMAERFMTKYDPSLSAISPDFFNTPVYCTLGGPDTTCTGTPLAGMLVRKTSAIDQGFMARNPFDYTGDDLTDLDTTAFDRKLAETALEFRPAGCPDPERIRLLFTVDFNEGGKNGNCGTVNRFTWATDKPGKQMFFVGWIYDGSAGLTASDITDPNVAKALGNSSPNSIPMYDDGTNGDETAGDNIWSIYFDLPRSSPGRVLRIGYKYTWGTTGAGWSGSEEWPGNSRILEVVDDNDDGFVYRHDVFADEATNKDKANSNLKGSSITFATDLHACGTPEAHENKFDNNSCKCGSVLTPKWIGPLTVTCTQ